MDKLLSYFSKKKERKKKNKETEFPVLTDKEEREILKKLGFNPSSPKHRESVSDIISNVLDNVCDLETSDSASREVRVQNRKGEIIYGTMLNGTIRIKGGTEIDDHGNTNTVEGVPSWLSNISQKRDFEEFDDEVGDGWSSVKICGEDIDDGWSSLRIRDDSIPNIITDEGNTSMTNQDESNNTINADDIIGNGWASVRIHGDDIDDGWSSLRIRDDSIPNIITDEGNTSMTNQDESNNTINADDIIGNGWASVRIHGDDIDDGWSSVEIKDETINNINMDDTNDTVGDGWSSVRILDKDIDDGWSSVRIHGDDIDDGWSSVRINDDSNTLTNNDVGDGWSSVKIHSTDIDDGWSSVRICDDTVGDGQSVNTEDNNPDKPSFLKMFDNKNNKPMFREPDEWELNIIALEHGEINSGAEAAFSKYRKDRGDLSNLFVST
eukprot:TRINITY_DN8079_c0_g1_i1.p1 TRINITY_DN8079_c0_g1~~TRINITY_DN8079_c0_g1_i1.p1  ORF type:complete len:438 (+),score=135.90 TRINITY_DN8079_c0_g1_i1:85-1398(+)